MFGFAKLITLALLGLATTWEFSQAAPSVKQSADRQERSLSYFGNDILFDQDGVSHRFFSDLLSGKVVLINVVFTHCHDACPIQTQHLQSVRQKLGYRFGSEIMFLSLTVDPKRDNPAALKSFAQKYSADVPGWRFLGGEDKNVASILGRLGQWTNDPVNHNTLMIAGNVDRAHWLKLRPTLPPESIAAELLRLADEY